MSSVTLMKIIRLFSFFDSFSLSGGHRKKICFNDEFRAPSECLDVSSHQNTEKTLNFVVALRPCQVLQKLKILPRFLTDRF